MVKSLISKLGIGLLAGALSFLPKVSEGVDFYNIDVDTQGNSGSIDTHDDFIGGHLNGYTEGKDSNDKSVSLAQNPDGSPKTESYTDIGTDLLWKDYRGNDSLSDYNINTRYISSMSQNFKGNTQIKFGFDAPSGTYIDPLMFYTGEAIAESQFTTNGVRQVEKKAILSNTNAQGQATFSLDGLQASDGDDFVQFNIHREYNDLHFPQPTNGTISVTNVLGGASITNGQQFTYNSMTDAGVNVSANPGYHLHSLDVIRTDINTGDKSTNTVNFSTAPESYVSNFSTNLEDLVGHNEVVAAIEPNPFFTQYTFTFKDPKNEVDSEHIVAEGSSFSTNFPAVVYDAQNNKIRYRATNIDVNGVDVVVGGNE
jgi:hypothetical protein